MPFFANSMQENQQAKILKFHSLKSDELKIYFLYECVANPFMLWSVRSFHFIKKRALIEFLFSEKAQQQSQQY